MTLQAKLDAMKEESLAKFSPEIIATITAANKVLEESSIMSNVLKTGDTAPNFILKNESGKDVELAELCLKGTVIVNFYRGVW